jgi:hypothetical protein
VVVEVCPSPSGIAVRVTLPGALQVFTIAPAAAAVAELAAVVEASVGTVGVLAALHPASSGTASSIKPSLWEMSGFTLKIYRG